MIAPLANIPTLDKVSVTAALADNAYWSMNTDSILSAKLQAFAAYKGTLENNTKNMFGQVLQGAGGHQNGQEGARVDDGAVVQWDTWDTKCLDLLGLHYQIRGEQLVISMRNPTQRWTPSTSKKTADL